MKRVALYASLVIFLGVLGVSWLTHGTGVVRNDRERRISIPQRLTIPLQVQVAYNESSIFFRYRWPSPSPGIYHDVLRYDGNAWVVRGEQVPGSEPDGLYEDRVSMMVDDGSVPEFGRYGGYITIGRRLAGFSDAVGGRDIQAHPYLGQRLGLDDSTKYLPATRRNLDDWDAVVPEAEQQALLAAGYFIDLWQWRAHRSGPIGLGDDMYVGAGRIGDSGRASFATNWDPSRRQPRLMFDRARVGRAALSFDDLVQRRVGPNDVYFLREDQAVPFDPSAGWRDGDTLPRRILRAAQRRYYGERPRAVDRRLLGRHADAPHGHG
jgi:hypothetical protein